MDYTALRETLKRNNPSYTDAQLDDIIKAEQVRESGAVYWGKVPPYVPGTVPTKEQINVRGPDGMSAVGIDGLALYNPSHPTGKVSDPFLGGYVDIPQSSPYYWSQNPQLIESWKKNNTTPAGWKPYPEPIKEPKFAGTTASVKTASQTVNPSGYSDTVTLGNGQVVKKAASMNDTEWQKVVDGYISRFGPLKSGQVATTPTAPTTPARTLESGVPQFKSAQELANYVKANGIENLQQKSWWANSPFKQEAWNIISGQQKAQDIKINTGDQNFDNVANAYLDLLEQQYDQAAGEVPPIVDEAYVQALQSQVDQQYGPQLKAAREKVEKDYTTSLDYLRKTYGLTTQGYNLATARAAEDVATQTGQLEEVRGQKLKVQGRNLQEATRDTQLAYQQANRSLSGRRAQDEAKLGMLNAENVGLINREADIARQKLLTEQQRANQDIDLARQEAAAKQQYSETGLESSRTGALQDIDVLRANKVSELAANAQTQPFVWNEALSKLPSIGNVQPPTAPTRTITPVSNQVQQYAQSSVKPLTATASTLPTNARLISPYTGTPLNQTQSGIMMKQAQQNPSLKLSYLI